MLGDSIIEIWLNQIYEFVNTCHYKWATSQVYNNQIKRLCNKLKH